MLTKIEAERYKRQICLPVFGYEGQVQLKKSSILIIGCGGLGCAALQYLAAAGIGHLGILDDDLITLNNLPRQVLFDESTIGLSKVEVAQQRLTKLNPLCHIQAINCRLTPKNAIGFIKDYDIVLDATDNPEARYAINDACVFLGKPFIYGGIHQFEGHLAVFNNMTAKGEHGPNYRSLFPNFSESISNCLFDGILGPVAGIIGTLQALEAIKLILDWESSLSGRLMVVNLMTCEMRIFDICPTLTKLSDPLSITSEELNALMAKKKKMQIIDVREGKNKNTLNMGEIAIPFSLLSEKLNEIAKDCPIIIYCQKGISSQNAAAFIKKRLKLEEVFSLQGGIDEFLLKNQK